VVIHALKEKVEPASEQRREKELFKCWAEQARREENTPSDGVDVHVKSPPIFLDKSRLFESPVPIPLCSLVLLLSIWENATKRLDISSSEIPLPVSVTSKRTFCGVVRSGLVCSEEGKALCGGSSPCSRTARLTRTSTYPLSVNLTPFTSTFRSACRSQYSSPHTQSGTSFPIVKVNGSTFALARVAALSTHCSIKLQRENRPKIRLSWYCSILLRSRTSLTRSMSCSPPLRIIENISRVSSVWPSCSSSKPLEATTAFSGVLISWLVFARKSDLAPAALFAATAASSI